MGEQQIMDLVFKQGIFAVLFVWLFWDTRKSNKERETSYQEIIVKNQMVIEEQAKAYTSIAKDVNEIKLILVEENKEG